MNQSRLLLLVFAVLWFASCEPSASDVGIGLIHFEDDFTTSLHFYDEPNTTEPPVFKANLIYDSSRVILKTSLKKNDTLKFNPFYALYGRSILVLQIMEREGLWMKVITDDIKGITHWLSLPEKKLKSWRDLNG